MVPPLSRVELDLLRLVADGLTNREIGLRLRWSQGTVKKYVQRVLEKLDVSDRTQAAVEGCAEVFSGEPLVATWPRRL